MVISFGDPTMTLVNCGLLAMSMCAMGAWSMVITDMFQLLSTPISWAALDQVTTQPIPNSVPQILEVVLLQDQVQPITPSTCSTHSLLSY